MAINPATQLYAVLGHPIKHSLSPAMHNAAMAALKLNAVYLAFDVPPERLMNMLASLAELGFRGVNLTVPLKEVAFQGLERLDVSARRLRSVNTVKFTADGMVGYSTDGAGFLRALAEDLDTSVNGKSIFVLGCGGAGRAVALAAAEAGAGQLLLADLDAAKVHKLEREIADLPNAPVVISISAEPSAWIAACRTAELVVQATPVGMHAGDASLLPPAAFRPGQLAYDLIYNFPETVFMRAARTGGARVANGLGMLLHQGALALTIWTGTDAPIQVMRRTLEQAVYKS